MPFPPKSVSETLDYQITVAGPGWAAGDSIAGTPTITSSMPSLAVDRIAVDGTSVSFWLTGGVPGVAQLTLRFTTAQGRQFEIDETIAIQ